MSTDSIYPYQIMPDMTPEQFAELKEDIRRKGVLEPLEFDQDGLLIDGHHRLRAFTELINEGADLPMYDKITRTFASEEDKIAHVISMNVKRRHITPEQRQELVVRLRKPPFGWTLSKIASTLGIGITTAWHDIDDLPEEERAEIKALKTVGADGRTYTGEYAPRIFTTGLAQLQEVQLKAARAVVFQMPTHAPTSDEDEAPAVSAEIARTLEGHLYERIPLVIPDEEAQQRINAFGWHGGKFSHLNWLLPLLPPCKHFVDLYGGSAAVIINRAPSLLETYNDIDKDLVTFFSVVRNQLEDLLRLLHLTPYSREERRQIFTWKHAPAQERESLNDLERARRFFVLARQTRGGLAQGGPNLLNSWKFSRDAISRGMSSSVSAWETGIDGLAAVAARMRRVQIECYPALKVIELYDSPDTLFYADPPYVHDTRDRDGRNTYTGEMSDDDHRALAKALHGIGGRAAVSGYPSELYNELYADWHCFKMPTRSHSAESGDFDGERLECLWTNYPTTPPAEAIDDNTQPA